MTAASAYRDAPSVLLIGYLGTGNLGNDASLAVVVDAIRQRRSTVPMRILSFGPARTTTCGLPLTSLPLARTTPLRGISRVADRTAVKVWDVIAVARELVLVPTRDVIVPGSGYFESGVGAGAWGMPWMLAVTAVLCRLTGARLHLVAIGADSAHNRCIGLLNRVAAQLATSRSYRDELSRQSINDLGVDTSADTLTADLVFARVRALAGSVTPRPLQGRVGIGVQAWYGHTNDRAAGHAQHEAYIDAMGRIAAGLLDARLGVTLLIGDGVDVTAFEPIRDIVTRLGHDAAEIDTNESPDFDDLVQVMSGLDVVIASRYHNVVAASLAACAVISLGYGPKHRELMGRLGQSARAHDITDIDVDIIVDQVRQARRTHTEISRELRREALRQCASVQEHLDDLTDHIGFRAPATSSSGGGR